MQFYSSTALPSHSQARRNTAVNLEDKIRNVQQTMDLFLAATWESSSMLFLSDSTDKHVAGRRSCLVAAIQLHVARHQTWYHSVIL